MAVAMAISYANFSFYRRPERICAVTSDEAEFDTFDFVAYVLNRWCIHFL